MRPLSGYVLVQMDSSKYKHAITEEKKYDTSQTGVIVAVGDRDTADMFGEELQPGTKVFYRAFTDQDALFERDDKKFAFIKYKDIVGVDGEAA